MKQHEDPFALSFSLYSNHLVAYFDLLPILEITLKLSPFFLLFLSFFTFRKMLIWGDIPINRITEH
jgi:hypothetical protein